MSGQLEAAAASILTRAVTLDKNGRFTEALVCYQEGLQILVDRVKGIEPGKKKEALKQKVEEYIGRAEFIKKHIEKQKDLGAYHEQISIENNSKGHSYSSVMGRFLDGDVTNVRVEDPYIRNYNQCRNFLQFCELLVKKCSNLKQIYLITGVDSRNVDDQKSWLNSIQNSLKTGFNVNMEVEFSSTLHDRQIMYVQLQIPVNVNWNISRKNLLGSVLVKQPPVVPIWCLPLGPLIKTKMTHFSDNDYTSAHFVEYSHVLGNLQQFVFNFRLGNGWVIKIGRGLDYFKPADSKFAIGALDYDLRACHETTVDIFHSKDVKHTFG